MERTRAASLELWAYCGVCVRWFFVPRTDDPETHRVACPVCDIPSAIFMNRSDGTRHRVTGPRRSG